jgi:hypothetical protein
MSSNSTGIFVVTLPLHFLCGKIPFPSMEKVPLQSLELFSTLKKEKEPPFWVVQTIFRYQLWVFNDQGGIFHRNPGVLLTFLSVHI